MPICPKCKNEYRSGIKICADCGCELVESLQVSDKEFFLAGDQENIDDLYHYLSYAGLKSAEIATDPTGQMPAVYVNAKDMDQAKKLATVYIQQKQQKAMEEELEAEKAAQLVREENSPRWVGADSSDKKQDAPVQNVGQIPTGPYMNKADRAADNRSSAYSLILVGVAGIALLVPLLLDKLPVRFEGYTKILAGSILGAMFLGFIIMGFVSFKNSKKYVEEAKTEKSQREEMTSWLKEHLDKKAVDERLGLINATQEECYFKRVELLKVVLNQQFSGLNQEFLEHYIDEVYDEIF